VLFAQSAMLFTEVGPGIPVTRHRRLVKNEATAKIAQAGVSTSARLSRQAPVEGAVRPHGVARGRQLNSVETPPDG